MSRHRLDPILEAADKIKIQSLAEQHERRSGVNYRAALAHSLNPQPTLNGQSGDSFGTVFDAWMDSNVLFGRYFSDRNLFETEALVRQAGPEADYQPFEDPFVLSHDESLHPLFSGSESRLESMLVSRQHSARERDLQVLGRNPGKTILAGFAALPIDPTLYLDILLTKGAGSIAKLRKASKSINLIRDARAAYLRAQRTRPVLTRTLGFAALGTTVEGASEVGIRQFDPERTAGESAMNVAFAGLFTAGFGAVSGKLSSDRRARIFEAMHKDKLVGEMVTDFAGEARTRGLTVDSPDADYAEALLAVARKNMPESVDAGLKDWVTTVVGAMSPLIRMAGSKNVEERLFALMVSSVSFPRAGVPGALIDMPVEVLTQMWKARARDLGDEVKRALKGLGHSSAEKDKTLVRLLAKGGKFGDDTRGLTTGVVKAYEEAASRIKQFTDDLDDLMKRVGATEELDNIKRIVDEGYFRRQWDTTATKTQSEALAEGFRAFARSQGREVDEDAVQRAIVSVQNDASSTGSLQLAQAGERGRSLEQVVELPTTFEWVFDGQTFSTGDFINQSIDNMLERLTSGLTPRLELARKFLTPQQGRLDALPGKVNTLLREIEEAGDLDGVKLDELLGKIEDLRMDARDADILTALAASASDSDGKLAEAYVAAIPVRNELIRKRRVVARERAKVTAEHTTTVKQIKAHDVEMERSVNTNVGPEINAALDDEIQGVVNRSGVGRRITDKGRKVEQLEKKLAKAKGSSKSLAKEKRRQTKLVSDLERKIARTEANTGLPEETRLLRVGVLKDALDKAKRRLDREGLVENSINFTEARARGNTEAMTEKLRVLKEDIKALKKQLPGKAERTRRRNRLKMDVLAGRKAGSVAQRLLNARIKAGNTRLLRVRAKVRAGRLPHRTRLVLAEQRKHLAGRRKALFDEAALIRGQLRGVEGGLNAGAAQARQLGRRSLPFSRVQEKIPHNPSKWRDALDREMLSVSGAVRQARRHGFADAEGVSLLIRPLERRGDKAALKRMNSALLKLKGLPLITDDPSAMVAQASTFVKGLTALTGLGNVVISSFGDAVIGLLVNGSSAWTRGLLGAFGAPIRTLLGPRGSREEGIRLISALETVQGATRAEMQQGFAVGGGTAIELGGRAGRVGSRLAQLGRKALLLDWWNSRMKGLAAYTAMDDLLRAAKSGKITPAQRVKFRAYGLNDKMVERIGEQASKHGEVENLGLTNVHYALAHKWEGDPDAARAFNAYLFNVAQSSVVTPGVLDLPGVFSSPVGSFFTQYKSFSIAATNRIAFASRRVAREQGLGAHTAWYANAMIGSYIMGWVILKLKNTLAGRGDEDISVTDAWEQAGTLGIVGDFMLHGMNQTGLVSEVGGVNVGTSGGLASRQARLEGLIPSMRTGANLLRTANAGIRYATQGKEPTIGDVSAGRSVVPIQGAFYIKAIADIWLNSALYGEAARGQRLEENVSRYELGLPEKRANTQSRLEF